MYTQYVAAGNGAGGHGHACSDTDKTGTLTLNSSDGSRVLPLLRKHFITKNIRDGLVAEWVGCNSDCLG